MGDNDTEKKDEVTTLLTNAHAKISELTLTLKDRDAKIGDLTGQVKTLADWKTAREEKDLGDEVEIAFATYKDTKKLSDKDKAHMLVTLKAAPDAFRALYPKVGTEQRHLQRNLTEHRPIDDTKIVEGDDAPKHLTESFLQTTRRLMKEKKLSYPEAQNEAFKLRAG